jgi:hypothetical protein
MVILHNDIIEGQIEQNSLRFRQQFYIMVFIEIILI